MKRRIRKFGIIAASAALVMALLLPALSYVASQVLLRERIATSLTRWTGQPVEIDDQLSIRYFPRLSAVVTDLRIGKTTTDGHAPLRVEQANLQLSLLDALFGEANLSSVILIEPTLRISSADMGEEGPAILDNILRRWIGTDATPAPLGPAYLEFRDGSVLASGQENERPVVSNIQGRLTGLDADRSLRLEGGATWRNMPLSGSITIEHLRNLARLEPTVFGVNLRSNLGSLTFDGKFDPLHRNWLRSVSGKFSGDFTQLRRALRPFDLRLPTALPDSLSMRGIIAQANDRTTLTVEEMSVEDHDGNGTLSIVPPHRGSPTSISATLAFQSLDLLSLVTRIDGGDGRRRGRLGTNRAPRTTVGSSEATHIDIRLSANEASYGDVRLADLAVSGRFGDGQSALDINNADLLGGTLQGNWRRNNGEEGVESRLELHFADISGSQLSDALTLPGILPTGTASIDLSLAGPPALDRLLSRGDGQFEASFSNGELPNLDLSPIIDDQLGGGFFSLSRLTGDGLDYDDAHFKGRLLNGVAFLNDASIRTGRYQIELNGRAPYMSRSLALTGRLLAMPAPGLTGTVPDDARPQTLSRFFVGGSFSEPFITGSGD
ncbi:AsmA family protein [Notoacmeibacter ruber]|uniref:Uncharacterized protein n=1 Tax=Notoacmeibacter ruber TaxID=2670375 RepID=A0A3L7J9U8_9HYPH|nr:AsmA-like C-terminal region-containing protein [Notoacmeibacter ruber]RLQ87239.1 hypothetical protein D8780_02440 [Notoacmeibacter ruber]